MDTIVKMDRFGRLVLPEGIRQALQVAPPADFKAAVTGTTLELTLVPSKRRTVLKRKRGLQVASTGGRKFNAAEAVSLVREEPV